MREFSSCIAALSLLLAVCSGASAQPSMKDSVDTAPPGYTGHKFTLSHAYPTTKPTPGTLPWRAFDFKTQSREYMMAVLDYALDGNVAANWDVQNNAVRKWYHAPGLVKGNNGREYMRGLTRERKSLQQELHLSQNNEYWNWAVGMYNDIGAYTIGQVWADPANPDPLKAKFADGTVAFKLLFTLAPDTEVSYLVGAPTFSASVGDSIATRTPQVLRLLQVDIAVRDTRNTLTGWVYGTFVYHNNAPGTDPWKKLVPIGLMWGNDPTLTEAGYNSGKKPKQSWVTEKPADVPNHGWLERLNGPVDDPNSSCLSCHMFAGDPITPGATIPNINIFNKNDPPDVKKQFFRNIKAGKHPAGNTVNALDYSLQLHVGIKNFPGSTARGPNVPGGDSLAVVPIGMPRSLLAVALASAVEQGGNSPAATQNSPGTRADQARLPDEDRPMREPIPATKPLHFAPVSEETDGEVDINRDDAAPTTVATAGDDAVRNRILLGVILVAVIGALIVLLRRRAGGAPPAQSST